MRRAIPWIPILFGVVGCGLPHDPEGTLERVRGGTLRVGVSVDPPWAEWPAGGEPSGPEPDMVRRLARELGAKVEWVRGGESELMRKAEHFELDLVVGGITSDSPWKGKVALTRPFHKSGEREHVFALPPGENGWLAHLDTGLDRWKPHELPEEPAP